MSGAGAPDLTVRADGLRVAVIAGSWHQEITESMTRAAVESITTSGAAAQTFQVAGSFELPLAAQVALNSDFDAVVWRHRAWRDPAL